MNHATRYTYSFDGEIYDSPEECVRAIVEAEYEYDDEFQTWFNKSYLASDVYDMLVTLLNNVRAIACAEEFCTNILDGYAESICHGNDRCIEYMLRHGATIEEVEE